MQHFMKKAAALALAMVMALSLASVAFAADFPDMPDDWSTAALEAAVENGLISGKDGKIAASDNLTRAEMATIITRAFGAEVEDDISFADVKNDAWYKSAVAKAVHMGAMGGVGSNNFAGAASITRQEVFVVLARVLKLADGDAADLAAFSDADKTATWAVPAVAALVKSGYVSGSNGALNPTANITRAEFSQVMYNIFHNAYLTKAGTYEEVDGDNVIISSTNVTVKGVDVKGDVVIADGVGDGDVFFEDVTIGGRLVVRGGGMNSVHFKDSKVGTVIMSKVDGNVRLVIEGESTVETVAVEAGKASTDVRVEGAVGAVVVNDAASTVVLADATVAKVEVNTANATVSLAGKTVVAEMTVAAGATDTNINAEPNTEITKLDTAEDVFINNEDAIKECNDEEKVNPEKPEESGKPEESKAPGEDTGSTTAHTHTFVTHKVQQGNVMVDVPEAHQFDAKNHYFVCRDKACAEHILRAHDTKGVDGACSECGFKAAAGATTPGAVEAGDHSCITAEVTKHDWVLDTTNAEYKEATCGADGKLTYKCNHDVTYTDAEGEHTVKCTATRADTVAASGQHSYDAGKVTTAATCSTGGTKTYTCTVCATRNDAGEVTNAGVSQTTAPIAKLDHKASREWLAEAGSTGLDLDNVHAKVCTVCGEVATSGDHEWVKTSATQHKCSICGKLADHSYVEHKCVCGAVEPHEITYTKGSGTHSISCTYAGTCNDPAHTGSDISCTYNKGGADGHYCVCGNKTTTFTNADFVIVTIPGKVGVHMKNCKVPNCTLHNKEEACTYDKDSTLAAAGDTHCVCGQAKSAHKLSTAWTQIEGQEKHQHVCVCGNPSCSIVSPSGEESCTYTNGVCTKCGRVEPCDAHKWNSTTGKCDVCGAECTHTVEAKQDDSQHWKACSVCGMITKEKANHAAGAYATTPTGEDGSKVHTAKCTGETEYRCTHTYTQACGGASCTVTGCTVKAAADAAGGGGG